jgi:hypothetical protein
MMAKKPEANAVFIGMPDGAEIALSGDGSWTVRFDPVAKRIKFKCAGRDVFSIDAAGNLRNLGTPPGSKVTAV